MPDEKVTGEPVSKANEIIYLLIILLFAAALAAMYADSKSRHFDERLDRLEQRLK